MQTNVLEYLESSAARLPGKPAYAEPGGEVSFALLQSRTRSVGTALLKAVPCHNRPVVVLTNRDVNAVLGMFGVLQSGNFYVPLDPTTPEARLRSIFDTLSPAALVTSLKDAKAAPFYQGPRLVLEEVWETAADGALLSENRRHVLDVDPVYTIFTSGSTGAPKGIVVSHRSVIDFVDWYVREMGIMETDVLGNQAPFTFDLSVKNLYTAIAAGATAHILPQKFFTFPILLTQYLRENRVTVLSWATSAFHLVANSGVLEKDPPAPVRLVIVGGEALQAKQLNRWRAALPDSNYVNLYGPTEVTVDCTYYKIDRPYGDGEAIPIGTACANKEVLLLDVEGKPVPAGEPGEICVRGSGLAQGYYGDWDKTAAAFTQDPRNPQYPDRIYHTGDLATLGGDGLLRFLARKDNQIKHGGYRIELGEIETALNAEEGVDAAICLFDKARDRIVAVYAGAADPDTLAKAARKALPKYMVPSLYLQKKALPCNANGKIDRVRLKEEYDAASS